MSRPRVTYDVVVDQPKPCIAGGSSNKLRKSDEPARAGSSVHDWTRSVLVVMAVTRMATAASRLVFLLRLLGDQRLGGQHQAGHARRVLDRGAHDLCGVDHAGLDEVFVLQRLSVEAE